MPSLWPDPSGNGRKLGAILNVLSNEPMGRLFSMRQDFSTAFARLLHSPVGTSVTLDITDKYLPAYLQDQTLSLESARLVVRTEDGAALDGFKLKPNGVNQTGFTDDDHLGGLASKDVASALTNGVVAEHTLEAVTPGGLAPTLRLQATTPHSTIRKWPTSCSTSRPRSGRRVAGGRGRWRRSSG